MQEWVSVRGIILKTEPIGDYDRRVVILTGERGKIAAFARGARRPNSVLLAANPFCFGEFKLFAGKNSYNIADAVIHNYFEGFREDVEAAFYGMYFLEVIDYYTRENNDEKALLNLLYQSLKALLHPAIGNLLVRSIFEIKALVLNGEYPGIPEGNRWEEGTIYALEYIAFSGIEKLYTFTVSEQILGQMREIADAYRKRFIDRPFKSLEMLKDFC